MRLRLKRGSGVIGTDPKITVSWGFDGLTLVDTQAAQLGEATVTVADHGNYDPYIDVHGLGVGRELLLQVVQTANVPLVLTDIELVAKELGR